MTKKNNKSNLLLLLRELSKKEVEAFNRYLQAFYAARDIPLRVWAYLYEDFLTQKEVEMDKAKAFKIIFPEETYNYGKISDALSDLYLLLEEFLAWQQMKENQLVKDELTLEALKIRGLKKFFLLKANSMEKKLEKSKRRDIWHWLHLLQLRYQLYYYKETEKISVTAEEAFSVMQALDLFFVGATLKFGSELMSRNYIKLENHSLHFMDQVRGYADVHLASDAILHRGYAFIAALLARGQELTFHQLKKLFFTHYDALKREDQMEWVAYLINFAAIKIAEGNAAYILESFDIYQFDWKKNKLLLNDAISAARFTNVIDIACKLKKFDWAEHFITSVEKEKLLEEDHQIPGITVGKALILYEKKEYNKVIKLLTELHYINDFYAIRARLLLLCAHFDVKNYEALSYAIPSFEQFLRRNKRLGKKITDRALNFCVILKKVMEPNANPQALRDTLAKRENIAYLSWLKEKINELER